MISRRNFLGTLGAGFAGAGLAETSAYRHRQLVRPTCPPASANAWRSSRRSGATTRTPGTWRERFLVGYPDRRRTGTARRSRWSRPTSTRQPENDLSRQRAEEFGFTIYPTIAEALRCGGERAGRRCRADHRRARQLPEERVSARRSTRATSSSSRSPTSSARTAGPSRSSTTSTCRGTGTGPRRWSTRRASWGSRSWPARRCRSPGGCRRSTCPTGPRSRRCCASRSAAWTATTSTPWRRSSAWPSGGAAARPAWSRCRRCAATPSGRRWRPAAGPPAAGIPRLFEACLSPQPDAGPARNVQPPLPDRRRRSASGSRIRSPTGSSTPTA